MLSLLSCRVSCGVLRIVPKRIENRGLRSLFFVSFLVSDGVVVGGLLASMEAMLIVNICLKREICAMEQAVRRLPCRDSRVAVKVLGCWKDDRHSQGSSQAYVAVHRKNGRSGLTGQRKKVVGGRALYVAGLLPKHSPAADGMSDHNPGGYLWISTWNCKVTCVSYGVVSWSRHGMECDLAVIVDSQRHRDFLQ